MAHSTVDIDKVKQLYAECGNMHKVARELHTSHLLVSKILKESGCSTNNIGKRRDVSDDELSAAINDYLNNHMTTEDISKKYHIRIKKLRQLFRDHNVTISKWNGHVKKEKPKKREPKPKVQKEVMKCPYCEWTTSDLDGRANAYMKHLVHRHNIDINEHLEKYPNDIKYLAREKYRRENMVRCKVCGKWVHLVDNRHLQKHGMNKLQYVCQYGDKGLISDETMKKYRENFETSIGNTGFFQHKSLYEDMVKSWLDEAGIQYSTNNREILDGLEIDILSGNIGIEINGNQWHTEWFGGKDKFYHLNKTVEANKKGIKLMHIFSDELIEHESIVKSKIYRIFGCSGQLEKIYGRKCVICHITSEDAQIFLDANHIQGFVSSTVYLGALLNGVLVGVMTFVQESEGMWNLNRFASDITKSCIGVGGKLFAHFVKEFNPMEVKSFADRRWTLDKENNLYTNLGFKLDAILRPDYRYFSPKVDKVKRFHKFGFRKEILSKKYELPMEMTELEMAKAIGFDRIWDCGLLRYIWKRETND